MINKFKKDLKRYLELKVDSIKKNQHLLQQTNFNYNLLSNLFKDDNFIPFTAWAISPSTILHVLNDITINKRKAVIEFGAGASTFYIAKLIKTLELDTEFYSIESDEKWAIEMERQLSILKINDKVKIIHAPLVEVNELLAMGEQKTWYDSAVLESKIDKNIKFDLILVDGPMGASTPNARYSAVPFLLQALTAENFSVFLDDVDRIHEKQIALEWQKKLGCEAVFRERYAYFTNTVNFDVTPFQLG